MTERIKVHGLGMAQMDYKITGDHPFPVDEEDIFPFIDSADVRFKGPGGIVPNTLTAFSRIAPDAYLGLRVSVGEDENGRLIQATLPHLPGDVQVQANTHTDIWVGMMNEDGDLSDYRSKRSAGRHVKANRSGYGQNELFLTDVSSNRDPTVLQQSLEIIQAVKRRGGIYGLNLGGTMSRSLTNVALYTIFDAFDSDPDVIFGNAKEITTASGTPDLSSAIKNGFPNSRLLVATNGERGALIRAEGEIIEVGASQTTVVDTTGAGDSYMGIFLAFWTRNPNAESQTTRLRNIARTASYGAGLVVGSPHSQLSLAQAESTLKFNNSLQ